MLSEIKTNKEHYVVDESGFKQGEYKSWYKNGNLHNHCFYKDGELYGLYNEWYETGQISVHSFYNKMSVFGEYKYWNESGILLAHYFFIDSIHNVNITDRVKQLVKDINNITDEEKFMINVAFGIPVI